MSRITKQLTTSLVVLAASFGFAPNLLAQDASSCSCMCVSGAPAWTCTSSGFFNPPEPESCRTMACPSVAPEPVVDTTPDPVDDPVIEEPAEEEPVVADIEPPRAGLECSYRPVYRPDLGRYKQYKVCKPTLSDEQKARLAAFREKHRERIEAHRSKRAERYASWRARRDARRAGQGDD